MERKKQKFSAQTETGIYIKKEKKDIRGGGGGVACLLNRYPFPFFLMDYVFRIFKLLLIEKISVNKNASIFCFTNFYVF